ncbi:uncharacterized protein LOC8271783 [Ricinus communis]|uniref:DUF7950 domain-containing protein n=1 Tax=Ricinus communis TaxID=3988 RepID=B9RBM8_RICCO|nr:uncharacterized protein LOC8271783 [Ricinus communis]EEF50949.1 conserved hypothetical protein [Ricinus communis]|eukprot:XP_002509562.1 uncharacterized protein LOC8271783 [Ricinus communis]
MDDDDGWRVITCSQDKTIVNRMMMRFRPIAPKPVTDGSSSTGGREPENKNRNGMVSSVRTKRKYVRVKKSKEYYKKRTKQKPSDLDDDSDTKEKLFTLQFFPEKTDLVKDQSGSCSNIVDRTIEKDHIQEKTDPTTASTNFSNKQENRDISCVAVADRTVFETVVTVESVTDTCMDEVVGGGVGLVGSTDVERMRNLEKDTCPGFISDGSSRVQWVNEAYEKMMMVMGRPESVEIRVRLVIKDKVFPYLNCPAFTCWVRLQYTWQKEKYCQMVPCDVWKMSIGGFAWRLDVKAALGLGL